MKKIPTETIVAIRSGKQAGQSLKQLANTYHVAKTTVSYHCRDLYSHPTRKYQTETEVRKHSIEQAKRFTCCICGNPTKSKSKLCGICYQKTWPHNKPKKQSLKLYPCKLCKTNMIRKPNGLCLSCYSKLLAERKAQQDKEREQQQTNRVAYLARQDSKSIGSAKCLNSPTGSHHWFINSDNIGTCKYCDTSKEMTTNKILSPNKN